MLNRAHKWWIEAAQSNHLLATIQYHHSATQLDDTKASHQPAALKSHRLLYLRHRLAVQFRHCEAIHRNLTQSLIKRRMIFEIMQVVSTKSDTWNAGWHPSKLTGRATRTSPLQLLYGAILCWRTYLFKKKIYKKGKGGGDSRQSASFPTTEIPNHFTSEGSGQPQFRCGYSTERRCSFISWFHYEVVAAASRCTFWKKNPFLSTYLLLGLILFYSQLGKKLWSVRDMHCHLCLTILLLDINGSTCSNFVICPWSSIYFYFLPLGWRVVTEVTSIIRCQIIAWRLEAQFVG